MLILQYIAYTHPDKGVLFEHINLHIPKQRKTALIGNNGSGKSTLLKIMAGALRPSHGLVTTGSRPYYVPQLFGQFNAYTIARALGVDEKIKALHAILAGEVTDTNLALLNDDWNIEERCSEALAYWKLEGLDLNQELQTLSGGQKSSVFLAGISIHKPGIILLDEPSNHLDASGRQLLYDFVQTSPGTFVVVSHDRKLLDVFNPVCELSTRGITVYGGNYQFYTEQKAIAHHALIHDIKGKEKALRKAKEVARETMERQQKLNARGKQKQEKAGLPTIVQNSLRNDAERSTARIKNVHAEKTGEILQALNRLKDQQPNAGKMKLGFDRSALPKGKMLVAAAHINFGYGPQPLWEHPLTMHIASADRVAVKGRNGSGKSTLIKLILGELEPQSGAIKRNYNSTVYIDQDYSLIDKHRSVYEQAQAHNTGALQQHEIKTLLARFLFTKEDWNKPCSALSGGEKMRLMLCCLSIGTQAPDLIILDEPTNNLDIQNIEILTAAICEYQGALIVITHDECFLEQVKVTQTITLA